VSAARSRYLLLVALAAPLLVYANSWQSPFHYDDRHAIADNPHIRTLRNLPAFFADPALFSAKPEYAMYRPLLLSTFALNHALSGYRVWSYHLVNVGLHLWAVFLVFRIGEALIGERRAACLAALLFGVHPVNSEAVNYLSSRSEVLAGAFFLGALLLFLRQRNALWISGAYLAGLLSKSTAIGLPAALACHQLLFPGRPFKRELKTYVALGALAAGYVLVVWGSLRKAALGAPVRSYGEQGWTQIKAVVFYLKLLICPSGLNVDHQFQISDSADPVAGTALVFLASLGWWAFHHRRQHPLPLFLLLLGLISLAPASLVPLHVLVNEHRLYLAAAAFALAAGYAAEQLSGRGWGKGVWLVSLAAIAGCSLATFERNKTWQSELALWSDAASKAPLMARPRLMLAEARAAAGQVQGAIEALEEGLRRDRNFLPGYARLGQLWQDQGRLEEAVAAYERGLQVSPQEPGLWAGLGEARRLQGEMAQSLHAYQQALALAPDQPDLCNNAGNALQELGRPAEALALHQRALQLDPGDARTWVNLGSAWFSLKDLEKAREAFSRAVELDSVYATAWYNLGVAREQLGQQRAAEEAYQRAGRLDPGYAGLLRERGP